MKEFTCKICKKDFNGKEAFDMHNKAKHQEIKASFMNKKTKKKIRNWSIFLLITILIIVGIVYLVSSIKTLPPITMQGHVEANPPSHVSRDPFPIAIQKHMLEHADGVGKPGIIINYNCEDYNCEKRSIEKLETFAQDYNHVYVAPFENMDAKIALTAIGRIEILENYDEVKINDFINGA